VPEVPPNGFSDESTIVKGWVPSVVLVSDGHEKLPHPQNTTHQTAATPILEKVDISILPREVKMIWPLLPHSNEDLRHVFGY
jgi:hypothetical protein